MGILYLTNAPKFVPARPTPNPKIITKINEVTRKESEKRYLKKITGFTLKIMIMMYTVSIRFSTALKIIAGLPISRTVGLKIEEKIAIGAMLSNPKNVPSIFPTS